MCIPNNAIELQAFKMSAKIQECTFYTPVQVIYTEGKTFELQGTIPNQQNQIELITKVVLQDKEGNLFPVEPNENGLKFAEGAITYREYTRLQKKEDKLILTLFILMTGLVFLLSNSFIKLFY